jgi:DMSO/TMAO reductase YedYZ molybdopterin-dependent catalytic subunit
MSYSIHDRLMSLLRFYLHGLVWMALTGLNTAMAQTDTAVLLQVKGAVSQPLSLTRSQLAALPRREFSEKRSVTEGGKEVVQTITYSGVLLRDLLGQAVPSPDRRQIRKAVVLLTAKDGYQASFSWGELFNSSLGEGVLVVLRQANEDLLETDGLPALRSLQDLRPGPRHVRWLTRVELLVPEETGR